MSVLNIRKWLAWEIEKLKWRENYKDDISKYKGNIEAKKSTT